MNLNDMVKAVSDAEGELRRADILAGRMADLLQGRLRKVRSTCILKRLKSELKDFNAHTGQWKEQK